MTGRTGRPVELSLRQFEGRAMASPLRLRIGAPYARDPEACAAAWAAVVGEFEAAEAAMSRFRESSEVTAVNRAISRHAALVVSWRLRRALVSADRAFRITAGRFDPRVLAALERLGDRGVPVPLSLDPALEEARRIVRLEPGGRVGLDAAVDLGGIGKGLALRWAADRVDALVPGASFLLEAGGDLVARGGAPEGPWRIALEHPSGGQPLAVIEAADRAVATSSVRVRHWTSGGREVHHLLDPRTGDPGGDGLLAVTVAEADPAWAEVWSKALFLAGRGGIAAEARGRGMAAWWVTDDGKLEMTPAARVLTTWTAVG